MNDTRAIIPETLRLSIQDFLNWDAAASVLAENGDEYRHRDSIDDHAREIVAAIADIIGVGPFKPDVEFVVEIEMERPELKDRVVDFFEG